MTTTEFMLRVHDEMTWAALDEAYPVEIDFEEAYAMRSGAYDPDFCDYMADEAADRYEDQITAGW